jgi:hypothetical protein
MLTTADATAPDPLFEAPAVLDIFDRFREADPVPPANDAFPVRRCGPA